MTVKVTANPLLGNVSIIIEIDVQKTKELHTALNGYLNTRPDAPKWIFRLCDSLELDPIPTPSQK